MYYEFTELYMTRNDVRIWFQIIWFLLLYTIWYVSYLAAIFLEWNPLAAQTNTIRRSLVQILQSKIKIFPSVDQLALRLKG